MKIHEMRREMEILLRRAYSAEDLFEWNCGLCEVPFTPRSVYPDARGLEGALCEECLAYLHARHPAVFPSIGRLRELQAAYPRAMFESDQAAMDAETEDRGEASRLWHECCLWTRE